MFFSLSRLKAQRAHFDQPIQFLSRRRPAVPEMRERTRAARRPRIGVGEIAETLCDVLLQNRRKASRLVSPVREILVAVKNGSLVPGADPGRVGVTQIDISLLVERRPAAAGNP